MALKKKIARKAKAKTKRKYVRKTAEQVFDAASSVVSPVKKTRRKRRKNKAKVVSNLEFPDSSHPTTFFTAEVGNILSKVEASGITAGSIVFTERKMVGEVVNEYSAVVNLL